MKLYANLEDVMAEEQQKRKIWKLVLTGGPCGGKTTGQTRYTFPETLILRRFLNLKSDIRFGTSEKMLDGAGITKNKGDGVSWVHSNVLDPM